MKFYKLKEGSENCELLVYKSNSCHHTTKPEFDLFQVNLGKLCNGNTTIPIEIQIWDNKHDGERFLGKTQITVDRLKSEGKIIFDAENYLKVHEFYIIEKYAMADYIRGGTELVNFVLVN